MFVRFLLSAVVSTVFLAAGVNCGCERDRNVQIHNPLYLFYGDGFFFIQGLTNGEAVVIYKHPDDARVFGQYTFKDEKCLYETVYYYVQEGRYEFTNPYITDEANFNITNKLNFVKNGQGYEIEYNISPKGLGIFQNLGAQGERRIFPEPSIKKSPAVRPAREIFPNFVNLGKQNVKVSYMKNGENYIQFVSQRSAFPSIEGQYTFRTSDKKYHSVTYEIPLDLDYNEMLVREYEVSSEDNFYKTGTISLGVNGTQMDVKYFVNRSGFHVTNLSKPAAKPAATARPVPAVPSVNPSAPVNRPVPIPVNRPANNRPVRNRPQPGTNRPGAVGAARMLSPSFSRPDLLTGERSVQPGK